MSNDNIRRLQYQIESEKKKISNCIHDYNEPFFNPDTIREAYGYNMVGHGSAYSVLFFLLKKGLSVFLPCLSNRI